MPSALFLGQDVDLGVELRVRLDRAGLGHNLAALDFLSLDTAQEKPDVVARLAVVERLPEHLDARANGLAGLRVKADDLDFFHRLELTALDTTRGDRAATCDREDVFDGHQERLVFVALGGRNVAVDGCHQVEDRLEGRVVDTGALLEGLQHFDGGTLYDRAVLEAVLLEEVVDFHLDKLEQLVVVDEVGLVDKDHDVRDADLPREQDVLARLGHRAVGGSDHEDRAVHLGRAGDHVLDEVGVTGAVDVGVVPRIGLVLLVRDIDRDAASLLLGSAVDLFVGDFLGVALQSQGLGDRGRQRRLAVVDVADGADIDVRLGPLEFLSSHVCL